MRGTYLLGLLALGAAAVEAQEWQELEIVPVALQPGRRSVHAVRPGSGELPRFIRLPGGSTILCQGDPEISKECYGILNKPMPSGNYDDEDWAYGDGYYYNNWADINEDADIGVLNMPYKFDDDPVLTHRLEISGDKPCGGCHGEKKAKANGAVVTSGTVQGGTVTSGTVQGATVTSGAVQGGTVTSGTVQGSTVTSGVVQGGTVKTN